MATLVAKLEAAKDGSADLTADIYEALGCEVIRRPRTPNGIAWRYRGRGPSGRVAERWEVMQRLAEQLDAAVTLVPDGWKWLARSHDGRPNPNTGEGKGARGFASISGRCPDQPIYHSYAATAALALCCAALKARAAGA